MKFQFKTYLKLLSKYLKNQYLKVVLLVIAIIGGIILQLVKPQILKNFIDVALDNENNTLLTRMAILYIILAIVHQVVSIITTYLAQKVGWHATNSLREDLVEHCLSLDMSFHKEKRPGELVEIIEGDVNTLFNFFSKMGVILLSNVILVGGVVLLYFRENIWIGIIQASFSIFAFLILLKCKKLGTEYWKKNREMATQLYGFIGESINNTEDIKGNGAKEYVYYRFHKLLAKWLPIRKKSSVVGWSMYMVTLALQATSYAIALLMGTYLWKQNLISIGAIYLFFTYANYIVRPIDAIQKQLQDMQSAGASIARLNELLERESKVRDSKNNINIDNDFILSVDDVRFSYEDNHEILKGISFDLFKGKKLGLIGRTGSGKTTLARLLIRFYDVNSGEIRLGKHNIKDISLAELKNKIAYVTQEVHLFNGTIRDNLSFYDKKITDERIYNAIEEMQLKKWFERFPNGLDTKLGLKGIGLSAGEGQLLAFIRVFLKDPHLIILDEVSSKLDPETERQLQCTIEKLLEGRLAVIIAHRIWTINFVDEIMILEKGEVLEFGSREELQMDPASHFHSLLVSGLQEEVLA